MPTYNYLCTNKKCGAETEEFFSVSKRPESIKCSKCGKKAKQGMTSAHFRIYGAASYNGYSGPSNFVSLDKFLPKRKK